MQAITKFRRYERHRNYIFQFGEIFIMSYSRIKLLLSKCVIIFTVFKLHYSFG